MSESGDALADITRKVANVQVNEDALKRVREAQWTEPQKFDYDAYNAGPKDQRSSKSAADPDADVPTWAANAAKYEWSDEYGDVGPAHPALEEMLFGGDEKMQKGEEFKKSVVLASCCEHILIILQAHRDQRHLRVRNQDQARR